MMKYLKMFENFNEEDIHAICKKYGIKNYTINDDGSIDVYNSVHIDSKKLKKLPLKFNKIDGDFYCNCNRLTSLKGCPKEVNGDFNCFINKLTSLKYCPKEVYGNFTCYSNKITSFDHLPFSIDGEFICGYNPIYNIW